jgi:hypothetical protein
VYVLLSTYTALRLSQICGGLCQTRKTPTLAPASDHFKKGMVSRFKNGKVSSPTTKSRKVEGIWYYGYFSTPFSYVMYCSMQYARVCLRGGGKHDLNTCFDTIPSGRALGPPFRVMLGRRRNYCLITSRSKVDCSGKRLMVCWKMWGFWNSFSYKIVLKPLKIPWGTPYRCPTIWVASWNFRIL